jgi:DNA repair exonuclease SbcCD nuclease subunit
VERERDFYRMIGEIADIAIERKVDGVIFAGDDFDCVKPSAEAVACLLEAVARLRQAGIWVVGNAGNHDACGDEWLKVCGITPLDSSLFEIGGIRITGKNWKRPSVFIEELEAEAESGVTADIYVIHQAITGLTGFGSPEVTLERVAAALKKMGVRYAALGDIHQYQETVVDGVRFCYPGSPERCSADDTDVKSVTIVDITPKSLKTSTVPVHPRSFMRFELKSEADVDSLMLAVRGDVRDPVVVVTYEPELKDLARRAEGLLRSANAIYRMYAVNSGAKAEAAELSVNEFERRSMMGMLDAAIGLYFDTCSEEYALVKELLSSPNPDLILKAYTDKKLKEEAE